MARAEAHQGQAALAAEVPLPGAHLTVRLGLQIAMSPTTAHHKLGQLRQGVQQRVAPSTIETAVVLVWWAWALTDLIVRARVLARFSSPATRKNAPPRALDQIAERVLDQR